MKWFENIKEAIEPHKGDRDIALYRFMPFDSLLQMLNEQKNTLVKSSLWEDSYENFMLKNEFLVNGKNYSLEKLSDEWFGQCWTTKSSSDAMWRIYSHDKKSVRIKTTVGRLWDSAITYQGDGIFMIGKVQYFSQAQILKDIEEGAPYRLSEVSDMMINSLYVKRNSFRHELEWRLVYHCGSKSAEKEKNAIQVDINPLEFIMNVYFDPRADNIYVDRCKKILVKAFNYPSKRIHKSSLYDFKPIKIELR